VGVHGVALHDVHALEKEPPARIRGGLEIRHEPGWIPAEGADDAGGGEAVLDDGLAESPAPAADDNHRGCHLASPRASLPAAVHSRQSTNVRRRGTL